MIIWLLIIFAQSVTALENMWMEWNGMSPHPWLSHFYYIRYIRTSSVVKKQKKNTKGYFILLCCLNNSQLMNRIEWNVIPNISILSERACLQINHIFSPHKVECIIEFSFYQASNKSPSEARGVDRKKKTLRISIE